LTLQEYFEKLKKDSHRWGKPLAALLGAFTAEQALRIPAIGGKDSMSGSFKDLNVPPCLLSFAVDIAEDQKVLSPEWKGPGHNLVMLLGKHDENLVPDFEREKEIYEKVMAMNAKGQILSAVSLREGGIAEALIHCTLGNAVGVALHPMDRMDLLSPGYGSILLEVTDDVDLGDYLLIPVGKTIEERVIRYQDEEIALMDLVETYLTTMNDIYPPFLPSHGDGAVCPTWDKQLYVHSDRKVKPQVVIPVFPGTNCEYDSADAFALAGAESKVLVIRNQTPSELADSIKELTAALSESQILMLPGGFSAGDEPEGSAKFITAIFRDPYLKEAVAAHLGKKNLVLGICNGFQALVKLGLLPHGEIRELSADDATLTFNHIGRHVSTMVRTKLISKLSPWFNQAELNKVYTVPVSHGEGRFVAPMGVIGDMISNGQIATQYVNTNGKATMTAPDNPNGSLMAIEGITDKTGLILGKMGHSERYREGLYKNIPGEFDQKIFESGVKYFK
jgi:phosphoribosylformylglycinamidine synthase